MKLMPRKTCTMEPKNPAAYQEALHFLEEHEPIDVLDALPGNPEAVYQEFDRVYFNCTDSRNYPFGTYSPGNWALRAAFVYGYLMAKGEVDPPV